MTQDEYDNLCERFEIEVELGRMELTKKFQNQKPPILYMGSPRLRKQLREDWEKTQRKELADEIAYQRKRSELEFFGLEGKEGAKAKIKEDEPIQGWERIQKTFKRFTSNLSRFITKSFSLLTGKIYLGR